MDDDRKQTDMRNSIAKTTKIAGAGAAVLMLGGCINLDLSFLFGEEEKAQVVQGPKAEFSCYREARYLDIPPEVCIRVGGLPVGVDATAVAETVPQASPHEPLAVEPLPPR